MNNMLVRASCLVLLMIVSVAAAQCTAKTDAFNGSLTVTAKDGDGFPIQLGMPEELEALPYVLLSCEEGTEVAITISKPKRVKDGGPVLAGPLRSYFYYNGKVYDQDKTLTLTGGFEELPIHVRLSLNDGKKFLLASDDYRYMTSLIITTSVGESVIKMDTFNPDKILLSLESKILGD